MRSRAWQRASAAPILAKPFSQHASSAPTWYDAPSRHGTSKFTAEGKPSPRRLRRFKQIKPWVCNDTDAVAACLRFAEDHRVLVEPACGAALAAVYGRSMHAFAQGCCSTVGHSLRCTRSSSVSASSLTSALSPSALGPKPWQALSPSLWKSAEVRSLLRP